MKRGGEGEETKIKTNYHKNQNKFNLFVVNFLC
jgi:hypothetical protein